MKPRTIAIALSAGIVGGVFAIAERPGDKLDPKITVDLTPPDRTGTLGGYAGVVDDVITEINRSPVSSPGEAYAKAGEREDKATLFRVTDGRMHRYMAIG